MAKSQEPIVLELATLPREQVGPFLLLGVDKTADKEQMEANWAERVKTARKGQAKVPLEDINWARDVLNDRERRIRADIASLNADTTDGMLGRLNYAYGLKGGRAGRMWQPRDSEKPLADYAPPAEVPDAGTLRAALAVPEVPEELPAISSLLEELVQQPLDPWGLDLSPADGMPS